MKIAKSWDPGFGMLSFRIGSDTMEFRQSKQTSGNMAWWWVQKYFCSLCSICALNHQTSIKNPCLHLENLDPRSKSLQRVICLVARNSVSYFPAGVHVTHVAIVNDFPTQDGVSQYHQGVPGQKRFVFPWCLKFCFPGPFPFCWLQRGYIPSWTRRALFAQDSYSGLRRDDERLWEVVWIWPCHVACHIA